MNHYHLAMFYRLKADISFFGFITLTWVADLLWAQLIFFISAIVVPVSYLYQSKVAMKENHHDF